MPSAQDLILAVDGGASKADLALVSHLGKLVAAMRCPGSFHFGLDRTDPSEALNHALMALRSAAGIAVEETAMAAIGVYCVAGADLPVDDRRISDTIRSRGWTARTIVRNDAARS